MVHLRPLPPDDRNLGAYDMTALQADRPLRLLSHNVYWFQGTPFHSKEPRGCDEGVLAQLLELYTELSPDVLCLQEVHEPALAQRLGEGLGMHARHCPGGREPQYGGALLWHGTGAYRDWRDRAEADGEPFRIWQELVLGEDHPAGALRILNVHLPSNSQRTAAEGQQQRVASLERLLALEPDVLMGDFNARPDAEELTPLRNAGYVDVAEELELGHLGTAGHTKRIDYAWVRNRLTARLRSYAVTDLLSQPHRPRDAAKDALSDHWPLCIELAATNASVPDEPVQTSCSEGARQRQP